MYKWNAPNPIQAPNILGATQQMGNYRMGQYGQQMGQHNANMQGLYSLGSTGIQHYGAPLAKALAGGSNGSIGTMPTIGQSAGLTGTPAAPTSTYVAGHDLTGLGNIGGVTSPSTATPGAIGATSGTAGAADAGAAGGAAGAADAAAGGAAGTGAAAGSGAATAGTAAAGAAEAGGAAEGGSSLGALLALLLA